VADAPEVIAITLAFEGVDGRYFLAHAAVHSVNEDRWDADVSNSEVKSRW
jgi:hypothetical protein